MRMTILAVLTITLFLIASVGSTRAAVQDMHLYGSYVNGWGLTASSITSPGPTITVSLNDVVNLTLTNVDTGLYAPQHQFLLSYENSSTQQAGDAVSPVIDPGQTVVFSFTANVSGTFTYYCVFHYTTMFGTFIVTPAVPEYPSFLMLLGLMAAVTVAVLVRRNKVKNG
jgi:FtsP/CotA-like multicopper oxidase with cupredoxin domain